MTYFATNYFTARSWWRTATSKHGGRLESDPIDSIAPSNNLHPSRQLTIDVASVGNPSASTAGEKTDSTCVQSKSC